MSETPIKRARTISVKECRACLTNIDDGTCCVDIFRAWDPSWPGMGVSIAEDLAKLSNIQINFSDPYSKSICTKCCSRLQDAIDFTQSVQNNDIVLRKRHNDRNEKPEWPKPIQVDKNIASNALTEMAVEVKQEILTEDEYEMNESCSDTIESKLDIKIEPEEITPASTSVVIEVTGLTSLPQPVEKKTVTNGATQFNDECLVGDVKEEPMSEDEAEPSADMPKDCMLCFKTFNTVKGLKKTSVKNPKTTKRGTTDLSKYKEAYEDVLTKGFTLRQAARKHQICFSSLFRYKEKRQNCEELSVTTGYLPHSKVFNHAQEKALLKYLKRCIDIYYGLSRKEVQRLAFELSTVYKLRRPRTWDKNELAGDDWFRSFKVRNPDIITPTLKSNAKLFFAKLQKLMDSHHFEPQDIYNIEEAGVTIVPKVDRVSSRRKSSQEESVPSAKKENLVTVAFAVNALGYLLPPFFVFPCDFNQDHIIKNGPIGSVGAANPSGWLQDEGFLNFLKFFKNHVKCSAKNKVLLVLNKHYSHIHIYCLDYCKKNGILLLSFPSHSSRKLQPLDKSCMGPFRKAINSSCDAWMQDNPGKTMSFDEIPSIVRSAMPQAFTCENIQAGFQKTGIYPFNRIILTDPVLAPSTVTNNPDQKEPQEKIA